MQARSKIVVAATLVAVVGSLTAGAANAEPKNQRPFTRPVEARTLNAGVRAGTAVEVAPMPEAKNELPFTRTAGVRGVSSADGGAGITFATGGDPNGIDWTLVGWGSVAFLTVAGGTAVALTSRRLPPRSRA
jgi:hypothetical protein